MKDTTFSNDRIQVQDAPGYLEIEVANHGWLGGALLVAWALAGLAWVVGMILSGIRSLHAALLPIVVLPIILLAIVAGGLGLWMIFGTQRLRLDERGLELRSGLGRLGRTRRFAKSELTEVNLVKLRAKGRPSNGRIIVVKTGKTSHQFGLGVRGERLRQLFEILRGRLPPGVPCLEE